MRCLPSGLPAIAPRSRALPSPHRSVRDASPDQGWICLNEGGGDPWITPSFAFCVSSLAQEVAGVAAGILAQIVLVIGLGAVPGARGLDRRGDRTPPLSRGLHARDDAARGGLLKGRLRKDRR